MATDTAQEQPEDMPKEAEADTISAALKAERVRDLRASIRGLDGTEMLEVEFQMISPGRAPVTIYCVEDGRPVTIPEYYLPTVMPKTLDDGRFMFVSDPKYAPEYRIGELLCFLHADAPERAILEKAGLAGRTTCRKHTLISGQARVLHAEHKHKQEWKALQAYLEGVEKREARDERRQQLEATLQIARGVTQGSQAVEAKAPPSVEADCPRCSWQQGASTKNRRAALVAHARAKHTAGEE